MTRCCRECKYAEWDADGCTCMIDGRSVYNASDYTCDQYRPAKPLTNADRIRQMTDEQLAEFLEKDASYTCLICAMRYEKDSCGAYNECKKLVLDWLRKEADEDAGTD